MVIKMKMIKNLMMKNRKYYKIMMDGKIFEGQLWVRRFFSHEGGYSAFIFIGKKCLGRIYINKLGILFNLEKIDSYNKIQYKETTIKKHFRRSIIKYFDSFLVEDTKITVKYESNYMSLLRKNVDILLCD